MHNKKSQQKRYLFYVAQNYSFEILRPLQDAIKQRGDEVKWFAKGNEVDIKHLTPNEELLATVDDVINYQPHASFVPGNLIPNFIPGLKVQVFHGLEWKKKGHFVMRGCFDLYCTHGEATTSKFNLLADKHGYFDVIETGWPKLDNLFTTQRVNYFKNSNPCILYAPTFSPALTSAPAIYEQIKELSKDTSKNWVVKFHPKMDKHWIAQYQLLASENFKIMNTSNINELLQSADIMLSDTSSVIGEFSLLNKPVISFKNSLPGEYLIDINKAEDLSIAITKALNPSLELKKEIAKYAEALHPYTDGLSSERILNAVNNLLKNGKESKGSLPVNLFRNLKQRRSLNYWKW